MRRVRSHAGMLRMCEKYASACWALFLYEPHPFQADPLIGNVHKITDYYHKQNLAEERRTSIKLDPLVLGRGI